MNAFQTIRQQAVAKRDAAIKAPKLEYQETIQRIAELESRLQGTKPKRANAKPNRLVDSLYGCLPVDRSFTLDDACGFLTEAEPNRKVSKATVRTHLCRLVKAGSLKRVQRSGHKTHALFAFPDVQCKPLEKTMVEWAIELLSESCSPMTVVEIMVKMIERGFQIESSPSQAIKSLQRELSKSRTITVNDELFDLIKT